MASAATWACHAHRALKHLCVPVRSESRTHPCLSQRPLTPQSDRRVRPSAPRTGASWTSPWARGPWRARASPSTSVRTPTPTSLQSPLRPPPPPPPLHFALYTAPSTFTSNPTLAPPHLALLFLTPPVRPPPRPGSPFPRPPYPHRLFPRTGPHLPFISPALDGTQDFQRGLRASLGHLVGNAVEGRKVAS